jgi:hypothetical protein
MREEPEEVQSRRAERPALLPTNEGPSGSHWYPGAAERDGTPRGAPRSPSCVWRSPGPRDAHRAGAPQYSPRPLLSAGRLPSPQPVLAPARVRPLVWIGTDALRTVIAPSLQGISPLTTVDACEAVLPWQLRLLDSDGPAHICPRPLSAAGVNGQPSPSRLTLPSHSSADVTPANSTAQE